MQKLWRRRAVGYCRTRFWLIGTDDIGSNLPRWQNHWIRSGTWHRNKTLPVSAIAICRMAENANRKITNEQFVRIGNIRRESQHRPIRLLRYTRGREDWHIVRNSTTHLSWSISRWRSKRRALIPLKRAKWRKIWPFAFTGRPMLTKACICTLKTS